MALQNVLVHDLTRRQWLKLAAAGLATGSLALAADASLVETQRPEVEHIDVALRRLPSELDGLTIAQLSDLHYRSDFSADIIEAAVKRVNELTADIVVLTGDYITIPEFNGHKAHHARALAGAEPCAALLGALRAAHGVFAVLGNHDEHADADYVTKHLKKHDIEVLRNRVASIELAGARLWLAGLSDLIEGAPVDLGTLVRSIPKGEPTILLVHEPDFADEAARHPIDLQFSGHSHGGQIRLPLVGPIYLPKMARKYPSGLHQVGSLTLYTNRGIGAIGIPVRLHCPPEITIATLRSLNSVSESISSPTVSRTNEVAGHGRMNTSQRAPLVIQSLKFPLPT